jgi:polyhydroxyalkanoate synthesis regulator protein
MQKNSTETSPDQTHAMDQPGQPALVKRYAGQRLYRPATSTYLTRGDLIAMVKNGKKFVVIDARTHDDVTSLYHPIIVER